MATFVLVIIVVTDGITVWLELVMVISSPLVSLDVYVTGFTVVIDIVDSVECTSTDVVVMVLGVMTDVIVTYWEFSSLVAEAWHPSPLHADIVALDLYVSDTVHE